GCRAVAPRRLREKTDGHNGGTPAQRCAKFSPKGAIPEMTQKHDSVGQEDRLDRRVDGDCSQHVPGDVEHTTCWGRVPEGGEVPGDGTSGEGRAGRAAGNTADKVLRGRGRGCVFNGLVLGDFVDGF